MFTSNQKDEHKSRLEYKLYLARENPEPIFDLSDCGLKEVPHGIYSLCKVFLKEILLLNNNKLSSLKGGGDLIELKSLKVLNLNRNEFICLPKDIQILVSLKELYLRDNKLKNLPESITKLANLRILDLSNNNLKHLPETIGDLNLLRDLSLNGNPNLTSLPKSFCGLKNCLKILNLDAFNFVYPPTDICKKTVNDIIEYILNDCGIDYISSNIQNERPKSNNSNNGLSEYYRFNSQVENKIVELEKLKLERQHHLLELEKTAVENKELELSKQNLLKENRKKLVEDLLEENMKIKKKINELQKIKDAERNQLIQKLLEEEKRIEIDVNMLLDLNRQPSKQMLEQEALEEKRLIEATERHYDQNLNKNLILDRMKSLLNNETLKFQEFNKTRTDLAKNILAQENQITLKLYEKLKDTNEFREHLKSELQNDIELQKAAVASLLERTDKRTWYLTQQIHLINQQLARLTNIELNKRQIHLDSQLDNYAIQRVGLSKMLTCLLEQQDLRRNELINTLKQIEKNSNCYEDYWLIQYQRILETRPESIDQFQGNLNPIFLNELLELGVIHCMPLLKKLAIRMLQEKCDEVNKNEEVNEEFLKTCGISLHDDRLKVLKAYKNYKEIVGQNKRSPQVPSAPQLEDVPVLNINEITNSMVFGSFECVICLDESCKIIFLNCGHLCTCLKCSATIDMCPLCRLPIEKRIQINEDFAE